MKINSLDRFVKVKLGRSRVNFWIEAREMKSRFESVNRERSKCFCKLAD